MIRYKVTAHLHPNEVGCRFFEAEDLGEAMAKADQFVENHHPLSIWLCVEPVVEPESEESIILKSLGSGI